MDLVIVGGAAAGLAMGSFGYVLVRFWGRPVLGYRRLKRRLAELLNTTVRENTLPNDRRDALRRIALELQVMVDEVLPVWYTMALRKREERPGDAVRHLQGLVNCREAAAIRRRAAAVRQSLGLRDVLSQPEAWQSRIGSREDQGTKLKR